MAYPPRVLSFVPDALVFDVFGTVYDWRQSVTTFLEQLITQKLELASTASLQPSTGNTPDLSTPSAIRAFASTLANAWRDSYKDFIVTQAAALTSALENGQQAEYITIDGHHLSALRDLLGSYTLPAALTFTPAELRAASRIWHTLAPWPDSKPGVEGLRALAPVATLSNGNVRLLVDLQRAGGVVFDAVLSAQMWRSYKPAREVYIGACELLGVAGEDAWLEHCERAEVGEQDKEAWQANARGKVAMVAAHIGDLRAAKACGLATIYVERPGEDDGGEDALAEYVKRGGTWIDMWVRDGDGGIVEVARRLGELKD